MYILKRLRQTWSNLQEVLGEDMVYSLVGLLFAIVILILVAMFR